MKRVLIIFVIIATLLSLSGCKEKKETKVIVDGIEVNILSDERMHELVEANNAVASTIYGELTFFNMAELECHFKEYYTQQAFNSYFNSGIFYEADGSIICHIKTDTKRENIAHLDYEIMKDSIYFVNNTQTFKVKYYNDYLTYIIQFVAEYDHEMQDWLLQDIQL